MVFVYIRDTGGYQMMARKHTYSHWRNPNKFGWDGWRILGKNLIIARFYGLGGFCCKAQDSRTLSMRDNGEPLSSLYHVCSQKMISRITNDSTAEPEQELCTSLHHGRSYRSFILKDRRRDDYQKNKHTFLNSLPIV